MVSAARVAYFFREMKQCVNVGRRRHEIGLRDGYFTIQDQKKHLLKLQRSVLAALQWTITRDCKEYCSSRSPLLFIPRRRCLPP